MRGSSLTGAVRRPYTSRTMHDRWKTWIALAALFAALLPAQLWPTACGEPGMGGCCGGAEVSEPCCGAEALRPSDCCSGAPPVSPAATTPLFASVFQAFPTWQIVEPVPCRPAVTRAGQSRVPAGGILLEPLFTLHAAFLT